MPDDWRVVLKVNPAAGGLDRLVTAVPKYDVLASESRSATGSASSRLGDPLPSDQMEQQTRLLEDIVLVLNGGEGTWIRYANQFDPLVLDDRLRGPRFRVSPATDPKHRDIVNKIVDMAGHAYVVHSFAEHYTGLEHGRVNQALSSAFRVLYRLYLDLVDRIEDRIVSVDQQQANLNVALYGIWIDLEPFAQHMLNAKRLVLLLVEKTRQARERKRNNAPQDLAERASTSHFVAHDEKEVLIELRGGAVLRHISELMRLELGDREAVNLYEEMIKAASGPYLTMLRQWLTHGIIDDPFEEFAIEATSAAAHANVEENVDDYWDKRYSVRATSLPLQLLGPKVYNHLIVAGKYLNVIKDSGAKILGSLAAELNFVPVDLVLDSCTSIEDPRVVEAVAASYAYANRTLLAILRAPPALNLNNMFRFMRDLFLEPSSNDLASTFLEMAAPELAKPVIEVSPLILEQTLTVAKETSIPNAFNEYVSVHLSPSLLKDDLFAVSRIDEKLASELQLNNSAIAEEHSNTPMKQIGIEALYFDISVPFPLDVAVTRRTVIRYHFLSRYVMELQYTLTLFNEAWQVQMKDPRWRVPLEEGSNDDVVNIIDRANLFRQAQIDFVQSLLYNCTVEGYEGEFEKFMKSVDGVDEVSELVQSHIAFLDRALVCCLLTSKVLIRNEMRLVSLCRQYAKFVIANADVVETMSLKNGTRVIGGRRTTPQQAKEWFSKVITEYERSFARNLQRLYENLEQPTGNSISEASAIRIIRKLEPIRAKYRA